MTRTIFRKVTDTRRDEQALTTRQDKNGARERHEYYDPHQQPVGFLARPRQHSAEAARVTVDTVARVKEGDLHISTRTHTEEEIEGILLNDGRQQGELVKKNPELIGRKSLMSSLGRPSNVKHVLWVQTRCRMTKHS